MRGDVRLEQGDILARGAAPAEAGGGLDIVRAGLRHHAAQFDLLGIGEHARLDDDLEELPGAGLLHGSDLGEDVVIQAVLDPADVDDHIDLGRAVFHGVRRLEALGRRGVVAVWEADDRADGDFAVDVLRRAADVARRDADACATVLHAVVADGPDLRPGGGLAQQRVVDAAENILQLFFHMSNSLI